MEDANAGTVPIFMGIDLEPDQKLDVARDGPVTWSGVAAMREHLQHVGEPLERVTGSQFRVGWYLRMDPQMAAICGGVDRVVDRFGDDLRHRAANGAYLGLHVHAVRWDERAQIWVNDWEHPAVWLEHLEFGLDAFTATMGSAPLRHKFAVDTMTTAMYGALGRAGVRVSFKPSEEVTSHYFTRPARAPHLAPGASRSGGPWVIPPSSISLSLRYGGGAWRRAARRVRRGPFQRVSLKPYQTSRSPREFWDEVERSLTELPRPYVTMWMRCEPSGSWADVRQRAVLEALVDHPLARRSRFSDPLEFVSA